MARNLTDRSNLSRLSLAAFVLVFAALGGFILISSFAATNPTTTLPDGTIIHRGNGVAAGAKPPLVVYMGHTLSQGEETQTHWIETADASGLAVAIAQGSDSSHGWSDRTGELTYLEQNLPIWASDLGTDTNHVYLAGFSSGGNMAFYAISHSTDAQLPVAGVIVSSGWMDIGFTLAQRSNPVRLYYTLGSGDVVGPAGNAQFYSMAQVASQFDTTGGDTHINTVQGGNHCWPEPWATGCNVADQAIDESGVAANFINSAPGGGVIAGDLNNDGHVDISDLSILASQFRTNTVQSDINKDGIVNISDLSILLSNYTD